jgi:hypothetical protein
MFGKMFDSKESGSSISKKSQSYIRNMKNFQKPFFPHSQTSSIVLIRDLIQIINLRIRVLTVGNQEVKD